LDLPDEVRRGIADAGFTRSTPIQASTLPLALAGRDVAGQAQTGTGKTAAFLIATLTRLLRTSLAPADGRTCPRALIVARRELASDPGGRIFWVSTAGSSCTRCTAGGLREQLIASNRVDILRGTPGRLIDYFKQRAYRPTDRRSW
jgi:ATP-dependent RNA helicase RhlB